MSMTDLAIVRKSLRAHGVSTVITSLSVAIAVALLVVLFSLREHAGNAFRRGTGNMHVLVSADASPLSSVLNNVFYANPPQRKLLMSDLERLGLVNEGEGAAARPRDRRVEWAVPVQSGDSFRSFKTMATTNDFFAKFQPADGIPWKLREGAFFDSTWQVVLGDTVARMTNLKVGDEIFVSHGWSNRGHDAVPGDTPETKSDEHDHDHGDGHDHDHDHAHGEGDGPHIHDEHPLVVVGILEPTGSPHDRAVFMPLEASWVLHAEEARAAAEPTPKPARVENLTPGEKAVNAVYVRCRTNAIIGSFFDQMRSTPGITAALPNNQIVALMQIVGSIDQIILAIGVAVLVSSIVSVMLAVYSSMGQRRRQIAVLRVLGATRGRIVGLVLTESALIATLGAVAGSVLAIVAMRVASRVMLERTGLYIDPWVDPLWLLVVGVATIVLGALAGVLPAISAYRVSVIRSLRPLG